MTRKSFFLAESENKSVGRVLEVAFDLKIAFDLKSLSILRSLSTALTATECRELGALEWGEGSYWQNRFALKSSRPRRTSNRTGA